MRKIVKYVSSSTQKSQSFLKSQSTSVPLGLIKEFEIRWNTVYDMLLRAHSLREAIDKWIDQEIAGAKTTAKRKIECLRLSLREWNHIEGLIKLLEPFKKVTVAVSKAKEPMLNVALNVYNNLFEHLQHFISKYTAYSGIRGELKSAIESGLKKLQKYFNKADGPGGIFFNLATVLDPAFKLSLYDADAGRKARYTAQFKRYIRTHYNPLPDEPVQSQSTETEG